MCSGEIVRINFNFKPGEICMKKNGNKRVEVEICSANFQMFRDGKKWIQYWVVPTSRRAIQPSFVYEDELEKL